MPEGLVSVVIPTYNRAHCIGATLDSVLAQTYKNWEMIVVDDGSRDNTREVVAEYVNNARVRYIHKVNGGVSSARNFGIANATGDYIAFLDSDDIWQPWKLEVQVACFRELPDTVLNWTDMSAVDPSGGIVNEFYIRTMYSAYDWFSDGGLFEEWMDLSRVSPELAHRYPSKKVWAGHIFSQMLMGNLVHTSTVLVSHVAVKKAGLFRADWKFCEDYHYYTRLCRHGRAAFIDAPTILYQTGMADQLTGPHHQFEGAVNYLATLREFFDKYRPEITLPPPMRRAALGHAHLWVAEMMMIGGDYEGAREHLINSLRYDVTGRGLKQFAVACMPPRVRAALRSGYHALKGSPAPRTRTA